MAATDERRWGIVFATLNMRVSDLQQAAALGDAGLGLVLVGGSLGALAAYPVAARLIEAEGTRRTILASCLAMAQVTALVASFPNGPAMFVLLFAVGATSPFSTIAINVEADRVEAARTRARLMNRCHGAWSVVYLLASSLAEVVCGAGVTPALHLWLLAPAFAAATLVLALPLRPTPAPRRRGGASLGRRRCSASSPSGSGPTCSRAPRGSGRRSICATPSTCRRSSDRYRCRRSS